MPTVTLGFGADDDPFYVDPDASTPHFLGSASYFPVVDYSDLVAANSSITNAGALGTDDTATYATADQGGLQADFTAAYAPRTPPTMSVKARLTEAFDLPADVPDLTLRLIATARSTWAHTRWQVSLTTYDAAGNYVWQTSPTTNVGEVVSSAWFRHELGSTVNVSAIRTALASRRASMLISPSAWGAATPDGLDEVAFLGIELTWGEPELLFAPKPLRQHPRTDGLGVSSQRRMWPPSRGILRGSLRQGPGAIP